MRIGAKETIAGHAALTVRELLRAATYSIDVAGAARRLGCSRADATAALRALVSLGYLEHAEERYQATVAGNALAGARANAPIRRATAERLVTEVVERVHEVEREPRFVYVVTRLAVFGSYLDEQRDRLGDIDLLLELAPREAVPTKRRAAFEAHLDAAIASGRRFASFFDELAWPEREVRQFLRGRSKHLSFHGSSDAIAASAQHRVLYERGCRAEPTRPARTHDVQPVSARPEIARDATAGPGRSARSDR